MKRSIFLEHIWEFLDELTGNEEVDSENKCQAAALLRMLEKKGLKIQWEEE